MEIAGVAWNGWKQTDLAGITGSGLKWLEIAGKGLQDCACLKIMELLYMAVNNWTLLELAGKCLKRTKTKRNS